VISTLHHIERAQGNYLKGQIESGDPTRQKRVLQEVSKLYRDGWRILPEQIYGVELAIIGLVMGSEDAKVRRWALNTMAQLGREASCKQAILHALQTYHADAEVLAAAIAALFRLCKRAAAELRRMGFDEQTVTLAALQHVPPTKLDMSCLPLRLDRADAELLKLGLIVVGLNRAPPNLFEPNYSNAEIVRVVGRHHDPIVSQYSVWAITENPSLGVADLGIELAGVEKLPDNLRAWVYQLLAMDSGDTDKHVEYLQLGIDDRKPEVRLGLALGLRHIFSPTLEPIALEWFTRELNGEVRAQLLDHIVRHAERSQAYMKHATAAFERGSVSERGRMLAAAAGSRMHSTFMAIAYNGENDLFRGATIVNNKTVNIGNIQAGAMAIDGDANQSGSNTNTYNTQTLEIIHARLNDAEREVKASVVDIATQKEALKAIEIAKKEPTRDNLGNVVATLGKVESGAKMVLGAGTAIAGIAHLIAQATGHGS
jgi:hypothetical protein